MSEGAVKAETVYYDKGGVRVTNARFQVGTQTFAMSSVNSVAFQMRPPNSGWPMFILISGALLVLLGVAASMMTRWSLFTAMFYVPGALMAIWAFAASAKAKPMFVVALTTSSGHVQALESIDRAYVEAVVRALNDAVVSRG